MDREHKYRAWDKENKKMIYFDFNNIYGYEGEMQGVILPDEETVLTFNDDHNTISYPNYPKGLNKDLIIMEYTGLKDRIVRKDRSEAKEIYRCDIIKALNRNYDCEEDREDYFQLFEVTYLNGCYMFGNWNAHEFFNSFMYIEVIGNKFENPELLKEEK